VFPFLSFEHSAQRILRSALSYWAEMKLAIPGLPLLPSSGLYQCLSVFIRGRTSRFSRISWFSLIQMLCFCFGLPVCAQLHLMPEPQPQPVFGGQTQDIRAVWHNSSDKPIAFEIRTRLYQASSSTAITLNDAPWKRLEVLPGQTVLESVRVRFPAVKGDTRFLVQWFDSTNNVLGRTDIHVYPTNLLAALKPLIGDEPMGVFDPQDLLKPLLKAVGVETLNLEETGVANFPHKLAVIGPFSSRSEMETVLPGRIKALATRGRSLVWIQPPPEPREELKPSFFTLPVGKGCVVIVQAALVDHLAESPQAQMNLVQFCRQALHPEPARFPGTTL
jgi:hypothetical protein